MLWISFKTKSTLKCRNALVFKFNLMLTLERIFLLKRRNWQNSHRFLGYCDYNHDKLLFNFFPYFCNFQTSNYAGTSKVPPTPASPLLTTWLRKEGGMDTERDDRSLTKNGTERFQKSRNVPSKEKNFSGRKCLKLTNCFLMFTLHNSMISHDRFFIILVDVQPIDSYLWI